MKAPTFFVLLCIAVAVSATRSKHQTGHGSNTEDNPGKGRQPGQQIGSPDDASTSRSFSSSDRGSQSAGSVLGGAQALHNGQESRHNVGRQTRVEKQEVTNTESRDIGSQAPADMFQNMGNGGASESASISGQAGAAPNGNGGLDLSRAYRDGYRPRSPYGYGRWNSEDEGQQNGRRFGRPYRRPEDSQGGEQGEQNGGRYRRPTWEDYISRGEYERPPYDRRFRPRYGRSSEEYDSRSREVYDSRSSEEYRPRRGSGRLYLRRSGDDSREDQGRPVGQRRPSAFEGSQRSG
uniref:Uncharacterized protein n=1 Tax=Rhipicephalus appendiculatus TaxID=34631 RepID=A0A131YGN3_RHIAP